MSAVASLAKEYQEQGFFRVQGLLSPEEVAVLSEECERLCREVEDTDENLRALRWDRMQGGKQVDRFDPVIDISPIFQRLASDPRILALVEEAFGEAGLLMKDKVILKSAGVRGYSVHQDYFLWQGVGAPARDVLSVAVAIDPADAENGAVAYYGGRWESLVNGEESVEDIYNPNKGVLRPEQLSGYKRELVTLAPGDVVVFSSLVPHESGPNLSKRTRRVLYLTYTAKRHGDLRERYYAHYRRLLLADRAAKSSSATEAKN